VKRLPVEILASLLAATTVVIALPPYHLPPWAIFIGWAGTFAAGGPRPDVLRRIWPAMPVGSTYALAIVLAFDIASRYVSGAAFTLAQMAIILVLNSCLMYTGRLRTLSFIPGMFFGFASFFATFFGGFGPSPRNPFAAWVATVLMNALGPVYAWLTARYGSHTRIPNP
jgi:hypothetical protein